MLPEHGLPVLQLSITWLGNWEPSWQAVLQEVLSRKVAPSYLSSPLAVQATFPFVWVAGDVPDLERLSKGFSLWGRGKMYKTTVHRSFLISIITV